MTPLRQFKGVPQEVVRKAEGKQFVSRYGILIFIFANFDILSLGTVILISARPRSGSLSAYQMLGGWFTDWSIISLNYSGSTNLSL
jgi:hypothetical protein